MAKTMVSKLLTKAQFGHYKQILEAKAVELRRSMSAPAATIVARREETSDMGDLSNQSHEEWLFLNRNSLDISLLRQIKLALSRIAEQTYGICQDCEIPISTKRLEAVPWANYCVRCQDRHSFSQN